MPTPMRRWFAILLLGSAAAASPLGCGCAVLRARGGAGRVKASGPPRARASGGGRRAKTSRLRQPARRTLTAMSATARPACPSVANQLALRIFGPEHPAIEPRPRRCLRLRIPVPNAPTGNASPDGEAGVGTPSLTLGAACAARVPCRFPMNTFGESDAWIQEHHRSMAHCSRRGVRLPCSCRSARERASCDHSAGSF